MDNGIKNDATVSMDHISDLKIKNQFVGLKKDDILTLNVKESFTNHVDLAAMLNVDRTAVINLSSEDFNLQLRM